ncbi:MAG: dienelactone hydrolase family protein [Armatimonadetes bacterium]|nr:dienelactone hydrolase family protein [Armatimonadota bacterium]
MQTITLAVSDGTQMPAHVARPAQAGPYPGLLVFQEAFGVNAHIRDVTERFARAGYTAIAPALFHRTDPDFEGSYTEFGAAMPHMQALTEDGLAADVRAAHAWLASGDGGGATAIGSIGYCLGGRVSFLADSVLPLQASVSYYGGGIAPGPRGPGLLGRAGDLHAPLLLFWGGKDAHIGPDQRRAVEDALIAAGKTYTEVTFSQADHGFFCDARAAYEPVSARHSWALTLAFFETYLRRETA